MMHNDLIERLRELLAAAENADEPVARYWSEQAAQLVRPYLPTLLERIAALEGEIERLREAKPRKQFPILGGQGATIDFALVADHGKQANANHYQTVERLAARGGLSWCELYAVLHNRKWEKMDANDALVACRALEARYLAALEPKP